MCREEGRVTPRGESKGSAGGGDVAEQTRQREESDATEEEAQPT